MAEHTMKFHVIRTVEWEIEVTVDVEAHNAEINGYEGAMGDTGQEVSTSVFAERLALDYAKSSDVPPLVDAYELDGIPTHLGVYQTTREYGGPEEGGWYWDSWEHIESVPVPVELQHCHERFTMKQEEEKEAFATVVKSRHTDWAGDLPEGMVFMWEPYPGRYTTIVRPRYC